MNQLWAESTRWIPSKHNSEGPSLQTNERIALGNWWRISSSFPYFSILFPLLAIRSIWFLRDSFLNVSLSPPLDLPVKTYPQRKFDLVFLALSTVAPAIVIELTATDPEYTEVGKLTLNILTIVLMLFSPKIFTLARLAQWLPRFALVWLAIVITVYIHSGTTFADFALLFSSSDSGVLDSSLYGFAEPLADLFLTKNITAMYIVAVYGLFLYSARASARRIRARHHTVFLLLILTFASRQGLLSAIVLIGIARLTSEISSTRRLTEFALATSIGIGIFLTLF